MSEAEIAQAKALMSTTVDKTKMYVSMDQSKAYSEFRPRCGPGMSTIGFCKYFKKVMGVDVSETQVACAPKNIPNCEFKVGYSDKLPFIKSGSVDLFCSGESFNLMPHKETFAEADRVLRPGGTIALFGYDVIRAAKPEIDAVIQKVWINFLPYWPKESTLIFNRFKDITLPYSDYKRSDDLKIVGQMNLEEYMGLMKSLWPFVAYSKDHPEVDLAADMRKDMASALAKVNPPGNTTFDISWDMFILMGHKPSK